MIIEYGNRKVKVPDFLIVGAAKGGTTSVHHYLKQHSDVFMPTPKEPFFFSFMNNAPHYEGPNQDRIISDPNEYFSLFSDVDDQNIIGECSNSYLYQYEDSIRNIKTLYGDRYRDVKIVMVLRNPVDRTFSMYQMLKNRGVEDLEFSEAVSQQTIKSRIDANYSLAYDYLGFGMYYEQVRAYLSTFPLSRVYLTADLRESTPGVMRDLFEFIGVPHCDSIDYAITYNFSGRPRNKLLGQLTNRLGLMDGLKKPLMMAMGQRRFKSMTHRIKKNNLQRESLNESQRQYLVDSFREDIGKLASLLNRDLQGWFK